MQVEAEQEQLMLQIEQQAAQREDMQRRCTQLKRQLAEKEAEVGAAKEMAQQLQRQLCGAREEAFRQLSEAQEVAARQLGAERQEVQQLRSQLFAALLRATEAEVAAAGMPAASAAVAVEETPAELQQQLAASQAREAARVYPKPKTEAMGAAALPAAPPVGLLAAATGGAGGAAGAPASGGRGGWKWLLPASGDRWCISPPNGDNKHYEFRGVNNE
jgi:hypothetical protein